MPVLRLQTTIAADTALPRDRFVLTPHFDVGFDISNVPAGGSVDAQALCNDLATAFSTFFQPANGREIIVTAYDAQGTPPVRPIGRAIRNPNLAPISGVIREAALCLSFYSEFNEPRRRGRLYIPAAAMGLTNIALRPSTGMVNTVAGLAATFQGLGGTNVDWCVYSRADNVARPVTNFWVDDEWDVQRRRGLRSTTRTTGTTTEAGVP